MQPGRNRSSAETARQAPGRLWPHAGGIVMALIWLLWFWPYGAAGDNRAIQHPEWAIGYWVWQTGGDLYRPPDHAPPAALLYVQVGELSFSNRGGWEVRGYWPDKVPRAASYFAVWRGEGPQPPGIEQVPALVTRYPELKRQAVRAGLNLVGLQLDYDCPTAQLSDYARFLQGLRQALPKSELISVTALLDWFRPGTHIAEVIQAVDEFVPQFYDVGSNPPGEVTAGIAKKIDAAQWAGVFNGFARPYRIGLAAFGRIAITSTNRAANAPRESIKRRYFRDMSPLELTRERKLQPMGQTISAAGEMVFSFREDAGGKKHRCCPESEESIEMILPTPESVSRAYAAAQAMGEWCAGVVFFRWPMENEALALSPAEIQGMIAGKGWGGSASRVESEDGFCAATHCTDLYVRLGERFPQKPVSLTIRSSTELEYFLPEEKTQAKLSGPRSIEIKIPAYAGVPRIYLGRAVTRDTASFSLEEKQP